MLKGFICPDGKKVDFETCLKNCQQQKRCLSLPILTGIVRYALEERPEGYTATQICSCLRKSYFEKKYDYFASPREQLFYSYRGNVIHSILSDFDTFRELNINFNCRFVIEKRFFKPFSVEINGKTHMLKFSGKIDLYDSETKTLYDYKTISDFVKPDLLPRPHHVLQTNVYTYLLPETVEQIVIVYVAMNNVYEITLSPQPKQQVIDFIRERLTKLHRCIIENIVPEKEENGVCKICPFKQKCSDVEKIINKLKSL